MYKCTFSVLNLKVLSTSLARGMMFEKVFLRDQKSPPVFLEKYAEIDKFLYLQIVLKSFMLDAV